MKMKSPTQVPTAADRPMPASDIAPAKTIAHTIAEQVSDPRHRFHARGQQSDGRVSVAVGERLQRVCGRAHAN